MSVSRPLGVTILAILLMIMAALIIIGGTILVYAAIQSAYSQIALSQVLFAMQWVALGYFDIFASVYAGSAQSNIYLGYGLFVFFIIYAGLSVPASIGLLYMKNWGRYLALLVSIVSIIVGVITIFWLVGIIPLILGIVMVVYLVGDVKYEFQ